MADLVVRKPMPDDVVDLVAKEVAARVRDHIEQMYPDAARAVAWKSASLSIQGVCRNAMKSAGDAAEAGRFDEWLAQSKANRKAVKAAWKKAGIGYYG